MKKRHYIWILLLMIITPFILKAEGNALQQIGEVEINGKNAYAVTHPRPVTNKDGVDVLCGLLIVKSTLSDLIFPDAVGNVAYENSKYYVYLKPSTKKVKVKSGSNNLNIKINGGIDSKVVYETTIVQKNVYGYLTLKSSPDGIGIYIDDEPIGKTPIIKHRLHPGEHTVKGLLPGYIPYEETVDISPDKTISSDIKLMVTPDYKKLYKQYHTSSTN